MRTSFQRFRPALYLFALGAAIGLGCSGGDPGEDPATPPAVQPDQPDADADAGQIPVDPTDDPQVTALRALEKASLRPASVTFHKYPRGAVRELAVAREAIVELRGALAKGGGGVVLMDAINLVFDDERDHPISQPLVGYTMRLLEKETKSLPDAEACESAVRWVGALRYRGGRPSPYTAVLYERFRHRLVCRKPCDEPYPGCGAW